MEHAGARVRALVSNEGRERVEETIGGVDVVRLPRQLALSSAPVAAGMPGALRDEMRRAGPDGPEPPDVVNLHSPYPWGELSFLQARPDVPSVVLYHSDIVRQKRLLAAYRPFLERFLDRVDLIVTSSPNMVRSSPFLAPRAEKCRVVPFGLPAERLAATPAVLRRAAELRAAHAGRKIVLFVGRLVYYKGVDVLVRAMARRRRRPRADRPRPARGRAARARRRERHRRARDLPRPAGRRRALPPGTTPPTCSACPAWPAARPSASCRSRRTPRARRWCPPTCPPASRTPIPTASPGSRCRPATRPRSRAALEPPARRRRAARAPRRPGAGARAPRVHGPAHGRAARSTCTPRRSSATPRPRRATARAGRA